MTVETTGLRQKAVLWAATGRYDVKGEPLLAAPIEIPVRWEETNRVINGPDDEPITLSAMVDVDRVIALNSQMRLGALDNLPTPLDTLMSVVTADHTPDIKGRHFQRSVSLTRI
jgi:hypothetical protein